MDSVSLIRCGILFQAFGPAYMKLFLVYLNFSFCIWRPEIVYDRLYFVGLQEKADCQFCRSLPLGQRSSVDLLSGSSYSKLPLLSHTLSDRMLYSKFCGLFNPQDPFKDEK